MWSEPGGRGRGVGVRITLWNTREINYKKYIGSWTQDPRPRKRTKALSQRFIPRSNSDSAPIHTLNLYIFTSKHHIFFLFISTETRGRGWNSGGVGA